jgi:hypothetical protein
LPDRIESIELCMDEIEHRVSRAGKGIILKTTDYEMSGWVYSGLGGIAALKSINASFQAIHSGAREKVCLVGGIEMFGPFEVQIAA